MTHNTEIHKQYDNIKSVLSVGRTNTGKIYVDIRVNRGEEVLEVGDITITQTEWDTINDNLKQDNVKLFICPECGVVVSESDILEDLTTGGYGMCMCKFGNGQRILVRYDPYMQEACITSNEARLIRIIRGLSG